MQTTNKKTYGYTPSEYAKFKEWAWKMLLSFGLTYMFFYNGRQNINLVLTQMAEGLGSTIVGVLDWAVYMGAAIQASVFGWVKDSFGWPAIFITIGCLYIIMLVLTLCARKMKMRKI